MMKMPWHKHEAPLVSTRLSEAPAPYAAIDATIDYVRIAVVDADGKRIKEREARGALKLLGRL